MFSENSWCRLYSFTMLSCTVLSILLKFRILIQRKSPYSSLSGFCFRWILLRIGNSMWSFWSTLVYVLSTCINYLFFEVTHRSLVFPILPPCKLFLVLALLFPSYTAWFSAQNRFWPEEHAKREPPWRRLRSMFVSIIPHYRCLWAAEILRPPPLHATDQYVRHKHQNRSLHCMKLRPSRVKFR